MNKPDNIPTHKNPTTSTSGASSKVSTKESSDKGPGEQKPAAPAKNSLSNEAAKKQQTLRLTVGIGATVIAMAIFTHLATHPSIKASTPKENSTSATQTITLADNTAHEDPAAIWEARAENRLQQETALTAQLQASNQQQKTLDQQTASWQQQTQTQLSDLKTQLAALNASLAKSTATMASQGASASAAQSAASANGSVLVPPATGNTPFPPQPGLGSSSGQGVATEPVSPIETDVLSTPVATAPSPLLVDDKTPDTYVPAGAFVKAVILQGIDASAGVTSQSDPRPVLLRTIDDGTLPNNIPSHLNHCFIVGAGYGDASSERVYVRLERMSCMQGNEVRDYPVYGYVAGTDGKAGQRGRIVFRDKAFVERAFAGGLLAGLGSGVGQMSTTVDTNALGTTQTINPSQTLTYGAAQGVGSAMTLYAQYNIQRAEQYQPVIQMRAGNVVDIVFNRGFYLDGHLQANANSPSA